ncbi:DMT family transporter [Ferrimonas balearica]|uniref:DMT family transporter n=1 Tax=Ferrimonas balearica TaxID=44012 RepID=UPI001C99EDAF|nr:DMT family transporter [Ferrimonas balearica]MBY5992477.1 DMT family transporter [Ferrimonas balearica]
MSPTPLKGWLLALLATLIWSGNFIVARGLAETLSPLALAFWRWTVAVVVLLPFALGPTWRARHALRRHWRFLLASALMGVTLFNTLIYLAGHTTEALNLSLIAISSPIFILLFLRVFYGERLRLGQLLGTAITVLGVVLLITDGDLGRLTGLALAQGDLWMLLAALLWAGYTLLLRHKPAELSPTVFLLATFVPGWLMLLPPYWLDSLGQAPVAWSPTVIGALLYVGLGASLVAFFCWNQAVQQLGAARAGLVYYLLPLFSGLLGVWLLAEPIGLSQLTSMALILSGIAVATGVLSTQPKKETP